MTHKSLADYDYGAGEHKAYEQGCVDTHARYEGMQEQARVWLTGAIAVLAEMETHGEPGVRLYYGGKLREALSLDPTVKIECTCGSCVKGGA